MRSTHRFAAGLAVACVIAACSSFAPDLHAQTSGVIYACANPGNGNLRMVGAQEACRPNETRLTLNVGGGPATTLASISGQLDGCGQANISFAGVLVHIPGRAFSVFTGADGKFQIDNVPPGTYDIAVESGGAVITTVTGVVVAAAPVELGNVPGINTSSNPNHCGQCGVSCGTGSCVSGQCQAPPTLCTPGQIATCYSGPAGSANIGTCSAGTQVCSADGSAFGACLGEVLPQIEVCGDALDNDCNGIVDDGCQAPQCSSATDCGAATACSIPTCIQGACGSTFAPSGTSCLGGTCDGAGTCVPQLLSQGAACTSSASCITGACVDGFCCNSQCTGTCEACSAAKTGFANGMCAPIAAGLDPDAECSAMSPSTCGTTGACSGARSCQLYPGGTVCQPASCTNGVATGPAQCTGTGICAATATFSCAPYQCGGTACLTSCSSDAQCINGYFCGSGNCQPKRPTGATCSGDNICLSGNCFLGICL